MGKDISIPSKLFMVNKDAVYAMPVAALIVVLFPVLIAHFLTISVYLLVMLFIFAGSTKIVVTRDLLKTAMIMLSGVLIMAYSYGKEPLISNPMWSPPAQSSILISMFLTSVICFVVFIQGYFYSFTVNNPLSFLRYVFLYQWALVGIYFIVAYGFSFSNLLLGNITIILLPYIYLLFDGKPKSRFLFSFIILLYLNLILCRTAFVAAIVFFLTYYLYPYLIVNKRRYKLFFSSFILLIFLFISLYLLATRDTFDPLLGSITPSGPLTSFTSGYYLLNNFSKEYFGGKGLEAGREVIWTELLPYITDKLLFGYGIGQDSGYIRSTSPWIGYRGLDSHNIYIEMLLRGGILLLSFFIILFYRIWGSFYSISNNKMSRIAASGFLAFLFFGAGLPIGVIDNIVLNTLLWFYWGVASGNTWLKNHQHSEYESR